MIRRIWPHDFLFSVVCAAREGGSEYEGGGVSINLQVRNIVARRRIEQADE
jgi:hypothetical protein